MLDVLHHTSAIDESAASPNSSSTIASNVVVVKAKPKKVFKSTRINRTPQSLLNDPILQKAIENLPSTYNFELQKTIWRIRDMNAKRVALQMPEGLLMFSVVISDIIENFTDADTVIMGDVTYGACCVDDYTAKALGADLLVHYGHSCLVSIDQTNHGIKVLYIFVDIKINPLHFLDSIKLNFNPNDGQIALVSTIQFVTTIQAASMQLKTVGYDIIVPQVKPLSPGEILGCTSPTLSQNAKIIIYLGDGRFHLESIMISNPNIKAYKYDPYDKKFTTEEYDHNAMIAKRYKAIQETKNAKKIAIILGTLGRQGSMRVQKFIEKRLHRKGIETTTILLSEIFPEKLDLFKNADVFVQIACPRLSIDWGSDFRRPLLNTFELSVALGDANWPPHGKSPTGKTYPMDFYSNSSSGPWAPNFKPPVLGECKKRPSTACCDRCSRVGLEKDADGNLAKIDLISFGNILGLESG